MSEQPTDVAPTEGGPPQTFDVTTDTDAAPDTDDPTDDDESDDDESDDEDDGDADG